MNSLSSDCVERSLLSLGDTTRLQRALAKARRGEKLVIGFLGGSITEGACASGVEQRYASRVFQWWKDTFPQATFEMVNAGIGATSSNFGALRARRDVLRFQPDVLVIDYAVNDLNTEENARSFEGVVRQALQTESRPAVVFLFMLREDGVNAQEWFSKVGAHYQVPMVSYRDAIWPELQAGRIVWKDISPDNIHPNDLGHAYVAQTVVALLEKVRATVPADANISAVQESLPRPLLTDLFASTTLFRGSELAPRVNEGWLFHVPDDHPRRAGWQSNRPGSVLEFDLPGKLLLVQFWKINGPMGKVRVTVDGGEPVELDAWFDLTWGGYTMMAPVARDLEPVMHRVRIELLAEKNPQSTGTEFRVTGIGAAGV